MTGTYESRFQYLAKVPLLLIDDFGLMQLRPSEDENFHELVAERYERTATILTSIPDFDEWGVVFPTNKMIGASRAGLFVPRHLPGAAGWGELPRSETGGREVHAPGRQESKDDSFVDAGSGTTARIVALLAEPSSAVREHA